MHPLWQIKQIVTVDKERDVDRNNCFGGRGSGGVYIAFDGLVTWIAKNKRTIPDLWTYMDDSFGIDECRNKRWYHQYGKDMPANQVKLLSLWDERHWYRSQCEEPNTHASQRKPKQPLTRTPAFHSLVRKEKGRFITSASVATAGWLVELELQRVSNDPTSSEQLLS